MSETTGAYVTCEASVCIGSCRCHYVTDHNEPCGLRLDGNECARPTGHSGTCYDERTRVAFEDGWWADDRGNGSGEVESYADVPADVCDWLDETYTPDGVGIWLLAWSKADEAKRAHMVAVARIPSGGS